MRINAYCGDEEFELEIDGLDQIGKKITIIEDKRQRKFTIITIETIFKQGLFNFEDVKNQKLCTIEKIKMYLEEDEIH